ncbi:hypothetical protein BC830DRAFT_1093654, partial [Chytriomyces sp. MP71]
MRVKVQVDASVTKRLRREQPHAPTRFLHPVLQSHLEEGDQGAEEDGSLLTVAQLTLAIARAASFSQAQIKQYKHVRSDGAALTLLLDGFALLPHHSVRSLIRDGDTLTLALSQPIAVSSTKTKSTFSHVAKKRRVAIDNLLKSPSHEPTYSDEDSSEEDSSEEDSYEEDSSEEDSSEEDEDDSEEAEEEEPTVEDESSDGEDPEKDHEDDKKQLPTRKRKQQVLTPANESPVPIVMAPPMSLGKNKRKLIEQMARNKESRVHVHFDTEDSNELQVDLQKQQGQPQPQAQPPPNIQGQDEVPQPLSKKQKQRQRKQQQREQASTEVDPVPLPSPAPTTSASDYTSIKKQQALNGSGPIPAYTSAKSTTSTTKPTSSSSSAPQQTAPSVPAAPASATAPPRAFRTIVHLYDDHPAAHTPPAAAALKRKRGQKRGRRAAASSASQSFDEDGLQGDLDYGDDAFGCPTPSAAAASAAVGGDPGDGLSRRSNAGGDLARTGPGGDAVAERRAAAARTGTGYDGFPLVQGIPAAGSTIAFKIVELGANYQPGLSNYKEATLLSANHATGSVTMQMRSTGSPRGDREYEEGEEEEAEDRFGLGEVPGYIVQDEFGGNGDGMMTVAFGLLKEVRLIE